MCLGNLVYAHNNLFASIPGAINIRVVRWNREGRDLFDSTFRLNHSKSAKNKTISTNYGLIFCKTPFCIL
jgi:hypothetical protein